MLHLTNLPHISHHIFDDTGDLFKVLVLDLRGIASTILRLMSLKVLLVFLVFMLEVAILLDLVVVDGELPVVEHLAV